MTVFEGWSTGRAERKTRAPRTPALTAAARWLAVHTPRWSRVRSSALQLAGFAALDYAAYEWHRLVGFVAVGLTLIVLEALGGDK